MTVADLDADTGSMIAAEEEHVAHNYHPLPVVIATGEG
jgi:ornithine--oxo-acid transaminase